MAMPRRGDIALVRVALPEAGEGVLLPCIVLSDENYNSSGYLLALPITTPKGERVLPIGNDDCGCELAPKSAVQLDSMLKLHSSRIEKVIGKVKEEFYWEITSRIRELIE